jgi:hypothetical protein
MAEVQTNHVIDTNRLSTFLNIDPPDIQSIIDSAAEGVVFLLQQVLVKAAEFEQIQNEKTVLQVNYGLCSAKAELMGRTRSSYDEC